MSISKLLSVVCLAGAVALPCAAQAAESLKPFLAAPDQEGGLDDVSKKYKSQLQAAGFAVVGEYSPLAKSRVLSVTSDALKKASGKAGRTAYAAVMRVSLAEKDGKIRVSCTHPEYFAAAYHLGVALQDVREGLEKAVGCNKPFGAGEMSADEIKNYHYAVGMEYLDDVYALGEFPSFEEAVKAVETGLAANKAGVSKVYRVELPGKNQVIYGVSMRPSSVGGDKSADDAFVMGVLDQGPYTRVGYMPYEILVNGNRVEALHMRYRAALHFPELPMLGEGASFFRLEASPDAVEAVLREVVTGKKAAEAASM